MKKIAIFALAAMAMFTSCDILDNKPYDTYTKDNFFSSEANVELFVNYFYSEFQGYTGDYYFNKLNDDQAKTGMEPWTFIQVPASANAWNNPYNQIRRCNTLITKVEAGIPGMSEASTKHYIGVGRLFRAWHHYKLVRGFGDCYWIDHEVDPAEDLVYGARDNRDSVMDHVLEDLNYAVENISKYSTSRVDINKYVAQAIKAEICLYEGTFQKYTQNEGIGLPDANPERAEKFLKECANACEAIITSGQYALNPSYAANYNSLNLEGNKEMILYKHYAYPSMGHSVIDYCCGSTQVDGLNKAAFNSYLSADGELMTYGDDHGELIDGKPSMAKQIAKRDARLAVHTDALLQYKGNAVVRFEGSDAAKNAAASTSSTGYGVAKFDTDKLDREHRQEIGKGDTDAPIFWYAQILLNYAEAKAELGEFDATVQAATMDKLRSRIGNLWGFDYSFSDPMNNMGVSNLIWEIRRERRIELMFDMNDRYYSLLRWHQLDKLDTQKYPDQAKGAWIAGFVDDLAKCDGANYPFVDADGYIDIHNGADDRIFLPKYYLFPIPSGQIMLNEKLTQNPGW